MSEKMSVYLDNSATTRQYDQVTDAMAEAMRDFYGNPSSLHRMGLEAEKKVRAARKSLAGAFGCSEEEVIFTSCGTEADNTVLMGAASSRRRAGKKIITTAVEHPAILEPARRLESMGYQVEYIGVDKNCRLNMDHLRAAITDDTILISVMGVNNEAGTVKPVSEIARIKDEYNKAHGTQIWLHSDAVQAFGKIPVNVKKQWQGVDLISVSGHKIHGPKGIGFLYVNEKVKIQPIIFGGGQQKGMRSGTENVPAIAGLAKAIEMIYESLDDEVAKMYQLKEYFISQVSKIEGIKINGKTGTDSAPHVISVSVRGIRSEVMLHSLEERGIYVSAGSACASNKPQTSATLKAIGVERELLDSTIRFSFSVFTTKEEIDYTVRVMSDIIPMLRRYTRH